MGVALQDWLLNTNTRARACADSKVCQKLISAHMSQARRQASFGRWVFRISEHASVCVCACLPVCVRQVHGPTLLPTGITSALPSLPQSLHPSRCPTGSEPRSETSLRVTHTGTECRRRGRGSIQLHPVQRAAVLATWTPAPLTWMHCHIPTRCTLHTHWHSAHSAPATSL